MTGPNVSVGTEGMGQAASLFESTSSQFSSKLASINNEMAQLQASWTGDASTRFAQAMNDWESDFLVIIRQLNQMVGVMGGNAQAYNQTADQAASIAGNWSTGLEGI